MHLIDPVSLSFQYICYPWQDDSEVAEAERKQTCRKSKDCDSVDGQDMTCIRHHDRRGVTKGLCFADEVSLIEPIINIMTSFVNYCVKDYIINF